MNTNIFSNTLLEEVMNFKGDIIPIPKNEKKLIGEKEIGEMTQVEKVLSTLCDMRMDSARGKITKICGVDLTNLSEEEQEKQFLLLNKKSTKEQREEIKKLNRESEFFKDLMWMMIKARISSNAPGLSLRPGFKIVEGMSESRIMEELFSGFPGGMGIHVIEVGVGRH